MLLDLDRWSRDCVSTQIVAISREYGRWFTTSDQDALNLIVRGAFKPLGLRWNQTHMLRGGQTDPYSFFEIDDIDSALSEPAIIHFSGSNKPWKRAPSHHGLEGLWWDLLSRTSFHRYRPSWFTRLRAVM